jgi:protein phosphatase 1L
LFFAVEAFVETDQRYLQHDSGSNRDDGCTAVAAVLVENQLLVANVGDSRAVLSRNGKGILA